VLASKEQLLTRNKQDATTWYPEIVHALQKLRGTFVIDGEVCLFDETGIPNLEAMRHRSARKPVTYFVFDLVFYEWTRSAALAAARAKRTTEEADPSWPCTSTRSGRGKS
jgi:ATP-dependent DNA ligase